MWRIAANPAFHVARFMETSTETHFFRKEGMGQTVTDVPVPLTEKKKTC